MKNRKHQITSDKVICKHRNNCITDMSSGCNNVAVKWLIAFMERITEYSSVIPTIKALGKSMWSVLLIWPEVTTMQQ